MEECVFVVEYVYVVVFYDFVDDEGDVLVFGLDVVLCVYMVGGELVVVDELVVVLLEVLVVV